MGEEARGGKEPGRGREWTSESPAAQTSVWGPGLIFHTLSTQELMIQKQRPVSSPINSWLHINTQVVGKSEQMVPWASHQLVAGLLSPHPAPASE